LSMSRVPLVSHPDMVLFVGSLNAVGLSQDETYDENLLQALVHNPGHDDRLASKISNRRRGRE
jgi:hypothetical protein